MSCWFTRAPAAPGMLVRPPTADSTEMEGDDAWAVQPGSSTVRPPTADRTEVEGVMMPGQYSQAAVQSDHPRQTGQKWRG